MNGKELLKAAARIVEIEDLVLDIADCCADENFQLPFSIAVEVNKIRDLKNARYRRMGKEQKR